MSRVSNSGSNHLLFGLKLGNNSNKRYSAEFLQNILQSHNAEKLPPLTTVFELWIKLS